MRGYYTALLLDKLSAKFAATRSDPPRSLDVGKGFDLIVGTSTGGIIACGLAAGVPTSDIIELYESTGPAIFHDPMPRGQVAFSLWVTRHLRSAANSPVSLKKALTARFGTWTLADVYRERGIALAIPSLKLALQESFVFATPHFQDRDRGDYRLVDVCLATSAAPLYFPIALVSDARDTRGHKSAFIDGGLWANNPIVVALEEALDLASQDQPIQIVSVTTCSQPGRNVVLPTNLSWGVWDWKAGSRALGASIDAQSSRYTGIVKALADHLKRPCSVLRLNGTVAGAVFEQFLGMDQTSAEAMQILRELAEKDADDILGQASDMRRTGETRPEGGRETRKWNDFGMLFDIFDAMPVSGLSGPRPARRSKAHRVDASQ